MVGSIQCWTKTRNAIDWQLTFSIIHTEVIEKCLLFRSAITIRLRAKRACEIIRWDMEEHKGAPYVVKVRPPLNQFENKHLAQFLDQMKDVAKTQPPGGHVDERVFNDCARQVHKGFRVLRKTVARRNPGYETSDSETETETESKQIQGEADVAETTNKLTKINIELVKEGNVYKANQPLVLDDEHEHGGDRPTTSMSSGDDAHLHSLVEGLTADRQRLMKEVDRWDEQGNEIIVLAKKMCVIMMDLSHFTRGTGPLETRRDVINAADQIAKQGKEMTELVHRVLQKCPQSHTRSDLVAYIHKIALYSHQLKVTAKVQGEVQVTGEEEAWTQMGDETAKSLIETARNLMSAVMLTVRACYVASTKHRSDKK